MDLKAKGSGEAVNINLGSSEFRIGVCHLRRSQACAEPQWVPAVSGVQLEIERDQKRWPNKANRGQVGVVLKNPGEWF